MSTQMGVNLGARGLLFAAGTATTVGLGAGAYVLRDHWMPQTEVVAESAPSALYEPSEPVEATEPDLAQTPSVAPDDAPTFDVVRVDPRGQAVIAGHAAPGAQVELTLDGAEIETVEADGRGNFVAMLDLPTDSSGALGLASVDDDGVATKSAQTVIVAPTPKPPAVEPATVPQEQVALATPPAEDPAEAPVVETAPEPRVLLADEEGIKVLQDGSGEAELANVVIDTITYDDDGEVQLGGRGQPEADLRIYLDNAAVQTTKVLADGQWRTTLADIAVGIYTLRVDELTDEGKVASRVETPFKREAPEQLVAAAEAQQAVVEDSTPSVASAVSETAPERVTAVTVQPGSTLWAIAREHLGDGPLYVQVFDANRDQIRNPDLIYPGQVFSLPKDG